MSSDTFDPRQRDLGLPEFDTTAQPGLFEPMISEPSLEPTGSSAENDQQLRAIFANSSDAILCIDDTLHIREANPAAARLFGWDTKYLVGRHCSEVLICRDEHDQLLCHTPACPIAQVIESTRTDYPSDQSVHRDVTWQTAQGNHIEVAATIVPIVNGRERQAVVIARDTRPDVDTDHVRSHFISMVSHELRTPINSINGFLDIVLNGHVGPLTERQVEFLKYASTSTRQLMMLVEDTLFISRADTGEFKLRLDTVNVHDLVAQVVQNCLPAAAHANVELMMSLPDVIPSLYADEMRLQQVLNNLIHNAIKFTPPEGKISVRVEVWQNELCFDVCDTGEGVSLDEQLAIFQRFYQSPNTVAGRSGGYGLGLAIAQLIVRQHGGRIWVTSAPPDGATFSFTIPLSSEPNGEPTPTGEAEA